MSKLSQLKQDAYQAAKARDWSTAVEVYEQILEIDKKNPTVVNELGDICLKAGEINRAVRSFLNAAAIYRKTGLLNNAVAIYKKILRHDETNLNAHWYLAETRASQGLVVEGEQHGLIFLENSGDVSGDLKEIFLKRCLTLFELFNESQPILEKLVQIFRMWEMGLEAGRAQILLCCLQHDRGETEEAAAAVAKVLEKEPAAANYPEYGHWNRKLNPNAAPRAGAFANFGAVDLGGSEAPGLPATPAPAVEPGRPVHDATVPADETSFADVAPAARDEASFADVAPSAVDETSFADVPVGRDADEDVIEQDDDGCISIDADLGTGGGLKDVLAAAAKGLEGYDADEPAAPAVEIPEPASEPAAPKEGNVDLLAQILAEDDGGLLGSESDQLETITSEIGAVVGGEDQQDDPERQYEMGMVYLDMGLHDQACASFQAATAAPEFAARAYEMWSMTLQKANRATESTEILERGLKDDKLDQKGRLGLLYHLGKAREAGGDREGAVACYEKITDVDPEYLDAANRQERLMSTI